MEISAHPVILAAGAGMLSWFSVSVGACIILLRKDFSCRTLDLMLGVAGGMMLGATFWSLLQPALELSTHLGTFAFVPPLTGLLVGALFLRGFDKILPHLHPLSNTKEGLRTSYNRSILLVLAMALHHIPEGLALGVGYGAAGLDQANFSSAGILTLSIMLQNIPEGLIVAMALRAEGLSAGKACFLGVLSGSTALLGAIPGALAAGITATLLPFMLAFAAGAMLYVIVEEVIPESQASGNANDVTLAFIGGLILVMILDTVLQG